MAETEEQERDRFELAHWTEALQNTEIKARWQMIEAAQREMEALIDGYAETIPEDLDALTPEERHEIYRMLRLGVRLDNTGAVEIEGVVSVPEKREHVNSGCR